jgi:50S ribosomal subunit-associated GTPase HflX
VPVLLIGNKTDRVDRKVRFEEANAVADEYGLEYRETSAKTGEGIEDAVIKLAKAAYDERPFEEEGKIKLSRGHRKAKGCC